MGMAGMHHATLLHTSDTGNGTVEAYNPCDGECTWGMQSFLIGLSVLMTVIGHLLPYVHAYSCTEPVWTERVRILCFWFISAPVLMLQNIVAIPVGWTSSSDQLGHYVFGALASFYSSGQLYFMFAKNQETDGSGQPLPESVLSLRRRQVSCKRDAGCCDRWLIALHDPTLYMDVFVMILGGLFGQTHVYEIYNFTGEYGLDKDWKVWRYNHEMFHLIMLEIVLLMGVLSLLISRYELLYKHVSDHGFSTSMLIFGIVFFKHSQEGEGYQKEVHDFWCLLMLVTSALRVLVGRGSKLRAQMAWCYMWASWVFMIAALEESGKDFAICRVMHFGPLNTQVVGHPPQVLTGIPPRLYHVDPLQVLVKRDVMQAIGWDTEKGYCADGHTLEELGTKHEYVEVKEVLGVHV